jgi:hypothetical protein
VLTIEFGEIGSSSVTLRLAALVPVMLQQLTGSRRSVGYRI